MYIQKIQKESKTEIILVEGPMGERAYFNVVKGPNGKNYVTRDSVCSDILHVAEGNTKFVTGDQVYQAIQAALNN